MAKSTTKPADQTAQTDQPAPDAPAENAAPVNDPSDGTNTTEPTPNSSPADHAQENPNAATGDDSDNTRPAKQESQPDNSTVPADQTASPTTEAELTHAGDATQLVPAGTADSTADHTADAQHNGTVNTLPQSPVHQAEHLSDEDLDNIVDEANAPGAVIARIAEKYGVTPERVSQIVDESNGVDPEDNV